MISGHLISVYTFSYFHFEFDSAFVVYFFDNLQGLARVCSASPSDRHLFFYSIKMSKNEEKQTHKINGNESDIIVLIK